jgi:hypothetical protein
MRRCRQRVKKTVFSAAVRRRRRLNFDHDHAETTVTL